MKKTILVSALAAFLVACGGGSSKAPVSSKLTNNYCETCVDEVEVEDKPKEVEVVEMKQDTPAQPEPVVQPPPVRTPPSVVPKEYGGEAEGKGECERKKPWHPKPAPGDCDFTIDEYPEPPEPVVEKGECGRPKPWHPIQVDCDFPIRQYES